MRVVDSCVDTGAERNYTAIRTGEGGRREEGGCMRWGREKVGEIWQIVYRVSLVPGRRPARILYT